MKKACGLPQAFLLKVGLLWGERRDRSGIRDLFRAFQHIPHPGTGDDQFRLSWVSFELPPQVADVGAQIIEVIPVFWAPNRCEKLLVGQDLIGMRGQLVEEIVFGPGEMGFLMLDGNLSSGQVDLQAAAADCGLGRNCLIPAGALEHSPQADQQLLRAEGLGEIVIRPCGETLQQIGLRGPWL